MAVVVLTFHVIGGGQNSFIAERNDIFFIIQPTFALKTSFTNTTSQGIICFVAKGEKTFFFQSGVYHWHI